MANFVKMETLRDNSDGTVLINLDTVMKVRKEDNSIVINFVSGGYESYQLESKEARDIMFQSFIGAARFLS